MKSSLVSKIIILTIVIALALIAELQLGWFLYSFLKITVAVDAFANLLYCIMFLTVSVVAGLAWFLRPKKVVEEFEDRNEEPKPTKEELKYRALLQRNNPEELSVEREAEYAPIIRQRFKEITGEDLESPEVLQEAPTEQKKKNGLSKVEVQKENLIRLSNAMVDRIIKDLNSGLLHILPDQNTIESLGLKGFNVKFEKDGKWSAKAKEELPEETPELAYKEEP